jgi:hypothetical protein
MLSHLRFHRRGPASNPTSPLPDQQPPSPFASQPPSFSPDSLRSPDNRPPSSSSSALPPSLPPITRVTSTESEPPPPERRRDVEMPLSPEPRQQPPSRPTYASNDSSFIGGVALQNYRRGVASPMGNRPENSDGTAGTNSESRPSRPRPSPSVSASHLDAPSRPPPQPLNQLKSASTFSTPTDLYHGSPATTGRRPASPQLWPPQRLQAPRPNLKGIRRVYHSSRIQCRHC